MQVLCDNQKKMVSGGCNFFEPGKHQIAIISPDDPRAREIIEKYFSDNPAHIKHIAIATGIPTVTSSPSTTCYQ